MDERFDQRCEFDGLTPIERPLTLALLDRQTIMTIQLSPEQDHSENSRKDAIRRMEEFGKKYHMSLGEPITRELLHEGH
jgi:hypothetical protein